MSSLRSWIFAWSGCGLACAVPIDAAETLTDPEVIVTATRVPTPVADVLAPVIVIDRDTIERSDAGDASDLLRFHAGLEVGRNGGPGQTTSIFIRGADSNHTLVLVDGVRINPGTIGVASIQNIPPEMIERIEVVKGPRSALWGTDAIGGVINIITRRGSQEGWSAEAGYGDYDTRKANLNGGFALGVGADLDLGVAWIDSAGFPTVAGDQVNRGFNDLSANAQLRADIGSAQLALHYWQSGGTTEYSDFLLTPVDQSYKDETAAADLAFPVGGRAQAHVTLSHFEDRIDQNQSSDFLHTQRNAAGAQVDWNAWAAQTVSAGAMLSEESARSLSYGQSFDVDTRVVNLFMQDTLTAGPHSALLALGYTDHETAGTAVTWNAEYGYALSAAARLYALAGSGFRAPDAADRYGFGGNPALKPERSHNYEVGLRQTLDEHQSLQFSAFRNDIDDLIEFVTLSLDPYAGENRNVAKARIEGLEAAWTYVQGDWQARVEAIYQNPRNLTDDSQLLRRAKQSLTVSLARTLGPVVLGLDVLASGERQDFGYPDPVTLHSYVLADLMAQWRMSRSLTLIGRVENLLNEHYQLASTYNTPGRGVYVSLRYARPQGQ